MFEWVHYALDKEEFITPCRIKKDSDYYNDLKKRLDFLIESLEASKAPKKITEETKHLNNEVMSALDHYYSGNHIKAHNVIRRIILPFKEKQIAVSNIRDSIAFKPLLTILKAEAPYYLDNEVDLFKARVSPTIENYNRKEMLHINFDNRGLIATQRFSVPGLPCLYLGTSSYDCWIEMDKPMESAFNVAAFRIDDSFKILNLCINALTILNFRRNVGKYLDRINDIEPIFEMLFQLFVLSLVTSYHVDEKNRHFHSEYILSQLIMLAAKDIGLDGITYLTKKIPNDDNAMFICVNLALFAHYNGEAKLSNICKKIEISSVVNYAEYRQMLVPAKHNISRLNIDSSPFVDDIQIAGTYHKYSETEFYLFDGYLINLTMEECNIDNINNAN